MNCASNTNKLIFSKRKKKEYKLKWRKELESNIRDSEQLWLNVKKFTTKTRQVSDILDEQQLEHFEKVLDVGGMKQDTDDETSPSGTTRSNRNSYSEDDLLNSDISPQKVNEPTDQLKANKAAGLDSSSFETLFDKIILFSCANL